MSRTYRNPEHGGHESGDTPASELPAPDGFSTAEATGEVLGIGFVTVRSIAADMGIAPDAPMTVEQSDEFRRRFGEVAKGWQRPRFLSPDQVRQLLGECVTVVKPGEMLVLRLGPDYTPNHHREIAEMLAVMHEHAGWPRVMVVPGDELGVVGAPCEHPDRSPIGGHCEACGEWYDPTPCTQHEIPLPRGLELKTPHGLRPGPGVPLEHWLVCLGGHRELVDVTVHEKASDG